MVVGILHFWNCLANAIKNHTFASLTSRSEHLSKYVMHVTWHNEWGKEIVYEVRDDISEKILFFTCFLLISSLWCLSLSN